MNDDFEPMDVEHCIKCGSYKGPFYDGLCPCCGEPNEAGEGFGRAETAKSATASTQPAQGEEGPARSESRCTCDPLEADHVFRDSKTHHDNGDHAETWACLTCGAEWTKTISSWEALRRYEEEQAAEESLFI